MTEVAQLPQEAVGVAMSRLLNDLATTASTVLIAIGGKTGLWGVLADGAATVENLAARADVAVPYARDWLHTMTAAGYVAFDPGSGRFSLAPGFDAVMTGPLRGLVEGTCDQVAVWWGLIDRYAEVYRSGAGISWAELPPVHAAAMDQITRAVVVPDLVGAWLPAIDGIAARLATGGRVADVGCGYGAVAVALAQAFPAVHCVGIDIDDASVSHARAAASDAGVAQRVTFEVASAAELGDGPYDLIVFSDSLHDFGDPEEALTQARSVLADDGVVLLVEHAGSDRLEENLDPVGRFFYACSALVCTPNALADRAVRPPLGSIPGEARLRAIAAAAGFGRIRRLEVGAPMNLLLDLRR